MSRQKIVIVACSIVIILLILWSVQPDLEDEAQAQLDAAYKVELAGELEKAVFQYEAVIDKYADTEAARSAADNIKRVKRYQERMLIQEVRRNLERVALVLDGYRSVAGQHPGSIEQLDNSQYMFDSDYVAEIPQEGFTYYLQFAPAGSACVLYAQKSGEEQIVRYLSRNDVTLISGAELDKVVNSEGLKKIVKGRMIFLQPAG